MLGPDKAELFSNVPRDMKARLGALKDIDPVLYSNSRIVTECLEAHLSTIEQRVQHSFRKPTHVAIAKRSRKDRVAA